jgi:hypothetical protein
LPVFFQSTYFSGLRTPKTTVLPAAAVIAADYLVKQKTRVSVWSSEAFKSVTLKTVRAQEARDGT